MVVFFFTRKQRLHLLELFANEVPSQRAQTPETTTGIVTLAAARGELCIGLHF